MSKTKNLVLKNEMKNLRVYRGLYQDKLAYDLGISICTVRRIEAGFMPNKRLSYKLKLIADYLDFPLEKVFPGYERIVN